MSSAGTRSRERRPASTQARLDFMAWLEAAGTGLTAPEPEKERPTSDYLKMLSTSAANSPEKLKPDAHRMWDCLKRCLDRGLSDRKQVEDFVDNFLEFAGLLSARRNIDQTATGWRLWLDGAAALDLAPHLFTGPETGVEILFRGAHLRISGSEDGGEDGMDRIRLSMFFDWAPPHRRDQLSLGDIVPATFVDPGERRKRIAARLIARSDSLRGWWPGPRHGETDAPADEQLRRRKLCLLLGTTD